MSGEIYPHRRRFLGAAAMTIAAAELGMIKNFAEDKTVVPPMTPAAVRLPIEGKMASLGGATEWLNSQPLMTARLRGKVVLVDFWTYTCINWLRTLPYVRAWAEKYKDQGLVVIGVHSPEFEFEKNVDGAAFSGAPAPSGLSDDEKLAYERLQFVYQKGIGYGYQMGLRPQTLYGIADSPVGLAAYFLDHDARSYELISRVFEGESEGLTRDDILDNMTITWLTNTALSGARLYWEYWGKGYFNAKGVSIPVAVSVFPDELYPAPRSWTEKAYPDLIHYNKLDKGGHFAAWEQPKPFCEEVRAGFRSLRSANTPTSNR